MTNSVHDFVPFCSNINYPHRKHDKFLKWKICCTKCCSDEKTTEKKQKWRRRRRKKKHSAEIYLLHLPCIWLCVELGPSRTTACALVCGWVPMSVCVYGGRLCVCACAAVRCWCINKNVCWIRWSSATLLSEGVFFGLNTITTMYCKKREQTEKKPGKMTIEQQNKKKTSKNRRKTENINLF